jgi:hypothetical protein
MKINKWMWQTVTAAVILSGATLLGAELNTKENRGQLGARIIGF